MGLNPGYLFKPFLLYEGKILAKTNALNKIKSFNYITTYWLALKAKETNIERNFF